LDEVGFILFLIYMTDTCRHTIVFTAQILLKYFCGARGVKFLEKQRENVQILQALR
jgi:hypothetical protein